MIADTIYTLGVMGAEGAFAVWAGRALGLKLRRRREKQHSVEAPEQDEAGTVKWGWNVLQAMSEEIHSLYHPPGCKCVMCEITANDNLPEDTYDGEHCSQPCFGCTVLTCKTHPDLRPRKDVTKPAEKQRAGVKFQHRGHSAEYWYNQLKQNRVDAEKLRKTESALESVRDQLKELAASHRDKVDEVVTLRRQLGQEPIYAHGEYEPIKYVGGLPKWHSQWLNNC